LEVANQQVQAGFQSQITAARTPALKREMAKRLLRFARETTDTATSYAYYRAAQRIATAAFAPDLVMEAIHTIAEHYLIDAEKEEQAALVELAANAGDPAALEQLLGFVRDMIRDALKTASYPQAIKLADFAEATVRQKNADKVWLEEISAERREIVAAQEAAGILQVQADDPQANYRLGRFLCCVLGDWTAGLPRLAKGSEPGCQAAAKADQAGVANPAAKKKLGDAWWDAAETMAGDTAWQVKLRARARGYYEAALPHLPPAQKQAIQQRLR
jgi:hypothetical protein